MSHSKWWQIWRSFFFYCCSPFRLNALRASCTFGRIVDLLFLQEKNSTPSSSTTVPGSTLCAVRTRGYQICIWHGHGGSVVFSMRARAYRTSSVLDSRIVRRKLPHLTGRCRAKDSSVPLLLCAVPHTVVNRWGCHHQPFGRGPDTPRRLSWVAITPRTTHKRDSQRRRHPGTPVHLYPHPPTYPIHPQMSVMIETSLGEVVMDLFCEEAPLAAKNFLKLCKAK